MINLKVRSVLTSASFLLTVFVPLYLISLPAATAHQNELKGTPAAAATVSPVAATSGASPTITDPTAHLTAIFKEIKELVKEKYPKAKITTTANSMHFDEKCKSEESFYSGHIALAPQTGGILCDISVKDGPYEGKDKERLPSEVEDGFHCDLVMAPYSKQENKHLLVSLAFPPDLSTDFKTRFETLINSYNADELAAEEKAAAASKSAQ